MEFLQKINALVWGIPTMLLIFGVGVYFTAKTGFLQFKLFPAAFRNFLSQLSFKKEDSGQVSGYQALCTALAATVGTGNLAGVAGAMAIGGPGAVFWMWVCAFLGMVIKFAEATLSVRYREKDEKGGYAGGTMYIIRNGLGEKWDWLGKVYCFFGVIAAFGVGNATQINTMIAGINDVVAYFGKERFPGVNLFLGVILAVLISLMLMGGAGKVASATEKLVPLAAAGYILLSFGVLVLCRDRIPQAFAAIFHGAFAPQSVTGGLVGSVFITLRTGMARGMFTNEAGMGTAGIAHANANVTDPVEQGLMGIMEVFLDTIVICSMTALVILCSGIAIPYGIDQGMLLTNEAFSSVYGQWIRIPMSLFLSCFAIATVLGWGFYGASCAQYLFGGNVWRFFAVAQGIMVIVSTVLSTGVVWLLSEIVNALMVIPNVIALLSVSPELFRLTEKYRKGAHHKGALRQSYFRMVETVESPDW